MRACRPRVHPRKGPIVGRGYVTRVAAACAKAGKWWGMPTGTPEAAQQLLDRGARMVTCGGDHGILVNGLREARRLFDGLHLGPPDA